MTYEELKAEADKLGYGLIKRTEYIKFKPCPKCVSTGNFSCWHRSSVGPFMYARNADGKQNRQRLWPLPKGIGMMA